MLTTELERLVEHLRALARPVVPLLLPGVTADEVAAMIAGPVPDSVLVWFGWCNGVAGAPRQLQDDVNVIPGYNPLSVSEAVSIKSDYSSDPVLGRHWMPLLGSAGGDIYAAVWTPGQDARIAGVLIGEPTEIEFASIEQMVSVFNECYQVGAFHVDGQGRLAMDSARYDQVYEQITGQ
ncbi:MAG: hypothetical protein J2P28_00110 [Actinobacteria bacterium]|nr:hypothetical protein [Actinomycetota bacterium]MBO0833903.1 hypothetical protein [Actinomycetota bacterium]